MPIKKLPLKKTTYILEPELIDKIKVETQRVGFGEFARRAVLSAQGLRTLIRRGRANVSTVKRIQKALTVEQASPRLLSTPPTIREILEDLHAQQQATLEMLGALQRDLAELKRSWA